MVFIFVRVQVVIDEVASTPCCSYTFLVRLAFHICDLVLTAGFFLLVGTPFDIYVVLATKAFSFHYGHVGIHPKAPD